MYYKAHIDNVLKLTSTRKLAFPEINSIKDETTDYCVLCYLLISLVSPYFKIYSSD